MDTNIHAFYAGIEMPEQKEVFRHLFCGLSRQRQQKIETMKNKSASRHSLTAWALLDLGLWRLYGLRERDVRISFGPQGKPYLSDYPDIQFNLSHSGDYALAAFASTAVGCDIQRREQAKRSERIASRFFSREEQRAMAKGMDFYRIWARKESFLKLTGAGMALDMRSFCVTGETCVTDGTCLEGELCRRAGTGAEGQTGDAGLLCAPFRFADFELPDYCLAVCYAGAKPLPAVWTQVKPGDFSELYSAQWNFDTDREE